MRAALRFPMPRRRKFSGEDESTSGLETHSVRYYVVDLQRLERLAKVTGILPGVWLRQVFTRTGRRIRKKRNRQCTFCNRGAGRSGAGGLGAASSARRAAIGRVNENKRLAYFSLVQLARIGLNFSSC